MQKKHYRTEAATTKKHEETNFIAHQAVDKTVEMGDLVLDQTSNLISGDLVIISDKFLSLVHAFSESGYRASFEIVDQKAFPNVHLLKVKFIVRLCAGRWTSDSSKYIVEVLSGLHVNVKW